MDKIRWGIIGPGGIAKKFASDLQLVADGELVAVASRNLERAQEFAQLYHAPKAFGSYEELFAYEEVDALYIATPHTSHAALTIEALKHGKHVLCEKPIAVSAEDAEKMVAEAKKQKVFLMEAMWSRFNPTIKKVKELVDSGAIGDVGYVNADFTFNGLSKPEDGRLLNPELAGGSILDIGIYPLFLAYLFLGKPKNILADANFYKTGVELQTSVILSYGNAQAILHSGLGTNYEVKAKIVGVNGTLSLLPDWHRTQGYILEVDNTATTVKLPTSGIGYSHEIEEVHKCLKEGKIESSLWSHQNSLDLIQLMDKIREIVGVKFPFEK